VAVAVTAASAPVEFVYVTVPQLGSVVPPYVALTGGLVLTVTGTAFDARFAQCVFDGRRSPRTVFVSSTTLLCTVPPYVGDAQPDATGATPFSDHNLAAQPAVGFAAAAVQRTLFVSRRVDVVASAALEVSRMPIALRYGPNAVLAAVQPVRVLFAGGAVLQITCAHFVQSPRLLCKFGVDMGGAYPLLSLTGANASSVVRATIVKSTLIWAWSPRGPRWSSPNSS
jgi:hypothetical protein